MRKYILYILSVISLGLVGCENLEKDIEVELPPFESKLVVEAYVEPNKKVKLLLTQTVDYFSAPDVSKIPVNDAEVTLTYMGNTQTLKFSPEYNDKDISFYNYASDDSLALRENEPIYLTIKDKKGRMATAETRWLKPLPIDSIQVRKASDTMGRTYLLVYFTDNGATEDFYRFRVSKITDTSSDEIIGYHTNDLSFNGASTPFGTNDRFEAGDTLEITFYHLPKDYYRFLVTMDAAESSNGNPFGQPARIESNVTGGLGIFTVLPYDRRTIVLK